MICADLSARKSRSCQSKALRYSRSFRRFLRGRHFEVPLFPLGGGPVSGALILVRPETLLGREFRDVGLLAQKTIALLFRDDDVPKAWKAS